MSEISNNRKIAKNSLLLYIDLIVSALLWFVASRFLLEALGVKDYGLYNVVGGIVVLLNVVNTAMISTSYRYIATELGKFDGNPNRIFNTCLVIHIIIAAAIIVLGLPVGIYYINHYLNVEGSNVADAIFVYHISIITCAISTFLVPYLGLVTASENFSFKVIVNISRGLIRFVLIFILLYTIGNRIRIYSIFALIPEIIVAIAYITYSYKRYYSIVKFKFYKDTHLYKEISGFAWWVLVGTSARICKAQGASLLINFFFGTVLNAALAISNTVNSFVNTATSSLTQAAGPQITKSISSGESKRSLDLAIYISKYSFILMLLVCMPFIWQTDFILSLWLTTVPENTPIFIKLILIETLIGCLGAGVSTLYEAYGKIRLFQISTSIIFISSILFGYLGYRFGLPPYSLLVIYCLMTLLDRIISCILLKYILKIDVKRLINFSYLNSMKLVLLSLPLIIINNWFSQGFHAFAIMVFSELILIGIIGKFGLNSLERGKLIQLVQRNKN